MEAFLKETIKGEQFELTIDTGIFSKDIILKTSLNFLERGHFFFKQDSNNNIVLQCTKKPDVQQDIKTLIGEFSDSLLEFTLRNKLEKDNKIIREAIVTKSIAGPLDMSNFVSLDTDNSQNRQQNEIDFDKDIDEILKEIEEDPDLKIDDQEIEKILKEIEDETQALPKPKITINADAIKNAKNQFKK